MIYIESVNLLIMVDNVHSSKGESEMRTKFVTRIHAFLSVYVKDSDTAGSRLDDLQLT